MSPVLGILAKDVGLAIGAGVLYELVSDYISKPSSPASSPTIPISKRTSKISPKTALKQNLGLYASGVASSLSKTSSVVSEAVTAGKTAVEAFSAEQSQKTSELATVSSSSPLLTNQVYMKDSIDKLVDAINTNSLISASVFGTLDGNLSAIGSSLTSISGTLIEISDNYSKELYNTDDLPYIDQETYYKMLADSGLGFFEINDLIEQENMLYNSLVSQGYEYDDIKAQIQNWRKYTVPISAQLGVEKELSGVSRQPRVDGNGKTASSSFPAIDLTKLDEFAVSQKAVNDYLTTPSAIKDLDGNTIASVKPLEAQSIKNITDARYKTDVNNFEASEADYDDMFDGSLPDISSIFTYDKLTTRLLDIQGSL